MSGSRRAAPSRRLYSEWTWRWTKSLRGFTLLPFDRSRGPGGDVEHDAVHARDLVADAVGDPSEEVVGQPRPVRRHRVLAPHRAQGDDLRVGAEVAHHADAPHGQEDGERLPQLALEPGRAHLV